MFLFGSILISIATEPFWLPTGTSLSFACCFFNDNSNEHHNDNNSNENNNVNDNNSNENNNEQVNDNTDVSVNVSNYVDDNDSGISPLLQSFWSKQEYPGWGRPEAVPVTFNRAIFVICQKKMQGQFKAEN